MRDRETAIVGDGETKIELRSGRSVFDLATGEYQFPLFEPDR